MSTTANQPVLVHGKVSKGLFISRVFGPTFAITGLIAILSFNWPVIDILLLASGMFLIVLFEVIIFLKKRSQVWVTDTDSGMTVADIDGPAEVRDEEVTALSLWDKKDFSDGTLKGIDRNVLVWATGRSAPIQMKYRFSDKSPDPLGAMIDRTLEKLVERSNETLDTGGHVTGEGWAITASGFAYGTTADQLLRFDQIQAVDLFDDEICIWRKGEDLASVRFPIKSRNSYLLLRLLDTKIPEQNDENSGGMESGLGRILFQRKAEHTAIAVTLLVIVGVIGLVIGLMTVPWLSALGLPLLIAAVIFAVWHGKTSNFRCHERGVFKSGITGESSLKYIDIVSFTYAATRNYYNGVYTGTSTEMKFTPDVGNESKEIKYSANLKGVDEDLDIIRDHISNVIASQMGQRVSEGNDTVWTKNLTFTEAGLRYRPSGFFGGKKEELLLPWEQLHGFDVQEGIFYLWETGNEKPIANEEVSAPNFFPGYYLLAMMTSPEAQPEDQAEPVE